MRGAPRGCGYHREHTSRRPPVNLLSWCEHGRSAHPVAGRRAREPRLAGPSTVDASTLLVYVMDIYDPWSYAYLPSVSAVLSAACSLVDVEVVHAGRYAAQPLSALADSVADAALQTTAHFGDDFLEALHSGRLTVDATAAASAMIALLATEELPVSTVLGAVQHEFFVHGAPIEAPGVLARVATDLGLDAPAVELFAGSTRAQELAAEDFEMAKDLDARGGPLLLASRGERLFEFDGLGASAERLVDQFRTVLTRP